MGGEGLGSVFTDFLAVAGLGSRIFCSKKIVSLYQRLSEALLFQYVS